MIKLIDDVLQTVREFPTEEALCRYIKGLANEHWQFAQYPPILLKTFVEKMEGRSFVHTAWKACQADSDMLIVGLGEGKDPRFFVVSPDLNVSSLQRDWMKKYCAAHKLRIRMM